MLNSTPAPRRGTAAAQWLEGPNYGMAPTTLMKEYFAYHASQHDRASDGLKKAVFEWCEVSGYMGPGDRFKVTEEASPVFGMTGTVKRVLIHNELEVRLDEEAYDHRRDGVIPRKYVTRQGYGKRDDRYDMNDVQMRRDRALARLESEMGIELDRLLWQASLEGGGSIRDSDGKVMYIGDLVTIDKEGHQYNGWICMIEGIKNSAGIVKAKVGMPPKRLRNESRLDEDMRKNRPIQRMFTIAASMTKLFVMP